MEFKTTEFMTAEEKQKVLKDFTIFAESNFAKSKFTKALYDHFHLHCGFTAHFNKEGFFEARFVDTSPKGLSSTISQLEEAHRHGGSDYQDINKAIANVIASSGGALHRAADLKRLKELQSRRAEIDAEILQLEKALLK